MWWLYKIVTKRTTRWQVPEANTGYFAFPFNKTDSSLIVSNKIPTTVNKRPLPAGDWELVRGCNEQYRESVV